MQSVVMGSVSFLFQSLLLTENLLIQTGSLYRAGLISSELRLPLPARNWPGGTQHHTQLRNCYFYYYLSSCCLSQFYSHYKVKIFQKLPNLPSPNCNLSLGFSFLISEVKRLEARALRLPSRCYSKLLLNSSVAFAPS